MRELVSGPLKEKWAATCREGAAKLYVNGILDSNVGAPPQRFDENTFESNLEDFYAICDQIEANLKCALEVGYIHQSICISLLLLGFTDSISKIIFPVPFVGSQHIHI